jgi:hypothetical protein
VWGNCSGSIIASHGADDTWSLASDEGTAAHWVGSETLTGWVRNRATPPDCSAMLGRVAPNGSVIDDKMVEGAQIYCDVAVEIITQRGAGADVLIECRVDMPQIHKLNAGTLDLAIVAKWRANDLEYMTIDLIDYKHGHRQVDAVGNLQLVDYLAGLAHKYGIDGWLDQRVGFSARIVAPFSYSGKGPVSEWTGTLSDLRSYFNQLRAKAEEAYTNPTFSPGKWCRDCPAVMRCDAAKRWLYEWADYANSPYVIDTMSGPALATELALLNDAGAVLKKRAEAIDDELVHRVRGGAADTGLALQATSGHNAWTIPPAQAIAIGQLFGVDIARAGALTPTQATQKVHKDLRLAFGEVLKTTTAKPAGKMKLIPAADSITARAFARPTE